MDHSPLEQEVVTLRAENAALKEQVVRLQTTPASLREDLRCVISDICAQVRERDETIAQQAAVIEQLREALDRIANTRVGQVDSIAQEMFNREDWAREALALQPSPEILDQHNAKIADACAKLGDTVKEQSRHHLFRSAAEIVASTIRSGEWRKHL